jgi:hypothetical protein
MPHHNLTHPSRRVAWLAAGFLFTAFGCDAESDGTEEQLRGHSEAACSVEKGEYDKACNGSNCAVELDLSITCPDDARPQRLQLALDDKRIWGTFSVETLGSIESRSFRVKNKKLTFIDDLPGRGFADTSIDGTMHRHLDGAAYLEADKNNWDEHAVLGLPGNYDSFDGFRIRTDGVGGLHAQFRTGEESGAYRFATQNPDSSWSWISLGSWDPNVTDAYVGKDAWDRTYSLIHTLDWEEGPQLLLRFSHFGASPVGESGEFGKLANPPRPDLGGDAPIATLRRTANIHKLLSIVDGNDWSEEPVAGTEPLTGVCPSVFNSNSNLCPPCHSETAGVEQQAYGLARVSGGQLWGAYLVADTSIDVSYTAEPRGSGWRCVGTTEAEVDATLHIVELAADGTALRTLELDLPDAGFVQSGTSGRRELAISAFDDRVAVLVPTGSGDDDELSMRLIVIDTDDVD